MLSEIINIEDLNIQDKEGLEVFETKLSNLQEELTNTKEHLGIVSFNSLAAMSSNQEISKESLKELQSHLTQDISHEELLKAHNTELLKDKISSLLAD
jgi:chaperonin cofactor prefoldin